MRAAFKDRVRPARSLAVLVCVHTMTVQPLGGHGFCTLTFRLSSQWHVLHATGSRSRIKSDSGRRPAARGEQEKGPERREAKDLSLCGDAA